MAIQYMKKYLVSFLIVFHILSFFMSSLHIALELDHECVEDHCPICHEINAMQERLNSLPISTFILSLVYIFLLLKTIKWMVQSLIFFFMTPITNKVRMNN